LPFLEKLDKYRLERFRFAALKMSRGSMDELRAAAELGEKDWRDLLVAPGFADSLDAHTRWEVK
jgi:hypothetical protein